MLIRDDQMRAYCGPRPSGRNEEWSILVKDINLVVTHYIAETYIIRHRQEIKINRLVQGYCSSPHARTSLYRRSALDPVVLVHAFSS